MTALIVMLIALGAFAATMTGGLLALKLAGKLPLVMGFSAGAVIGVAFFDLAPEALEAGKGLYEPRTLLAVAALGFFLYTVLDRLVARHDCEGQANPARGLIGAASFSAHSVLDGFAMGIAFQASREIGLIVAAAVLAHDFADGLNTVNVVTKNGGTRSVRPALAGGGCGGAGAGRGLEPVDRARAPACWRCCWRCSAASSCISAPAGFCRKATAPIRGPARRSRPCWARRFCMGDGAGAVTLLHAGLSGHQLQADGCWRCKLPGGAT